MKQNLKSYEELISLVSFEERLSYLMLRGSPGDETFGSMRHINQNFYRSRDWAIVRNRAISRDGGYDLGINGYPIHGSVFVHHINPITPQMLVDGNHLAIAQHNLITVSFDTHQRIHYSKVEPVKMAERFPGDTKLW